MAAEKHLAIVAEDRLTQAVLHKCAAEFLPTHRIVRSEIKNGRGNVQREIPAYLKLSEKMPVLLCVDLDGDVCAPELRASWKTETTSKAFLLRVAVREIESWVLGDRKRVASFLGAKSDDIAKDPDSLEDPKRSLLDLARNFASPDLKRDLIPRNYAQYPRIGPAYNMQLCAFVQR
ncbi:MAG: DUF4276 family protein, partial [Proteobacteria bacterium]